MHRLLKLVTMNYLIGGLLIALAGCSSWWSSPPPMEAWPRNELKPRRLILFALQGFPIDGEEKKDQALSTLSRLQQEGLFFPQAWLGHIPSSTDTSLSVLFSGTQPRHLPPELTLHTKNQFPQPVGLLESIAGPKHSKLFLSNNPELARTLNFLSDKTQVVLENQKDKNLDYFLHFLKSESDWTVVVVHLDSQFFSDSAHTPNEYLEKALAHLMENQLLSETALLIAQFGVPLPHARKAFRFIQGKNTPDKLPKNLSSLARNSEVAALIGDSSLRVYLNRSSLSSTLRIASELRLLSEASEVFTLREVSRRYHYIRTYRSPNMQPTTLEWSKTHQAQLLSSIASPQAPQVIAFYSTSPSIDQDQQTSITLWAPNIRGNVPAMKHHLQQARVRWVDIYPMIVELMGLPSPQKETDGSSIGLKAVIY